MADLQPNITSVVPSGDGIIRGIVSQATIHIDVQHMGAPFTSVSEDNGNVKVKVILSDHDLSIDSRGNISEDILVAMDDESWFSEAFQYKEVKTVSINTQLLIEADLCLYASYICVNLSIGIGASYVPLESQYNIACHDNSDSVICQPGGYIKITK